LARGRALLADDEEAERHYAESLDHLGRSGVTTEQARTRLLYGEWLRRRRRRRDARAHLRLAHELFEAIGAEAFARRATAELLATGETARRRVPHTRDLLTPRERQIAQLAAEGHTNAAIGAQLFISPHTVAYHLRKVFSKLGVTARSQLGHWAGEWIGPADAPEFESSEVLAV
jgi:DNA-binding CsgD family transcriptional regulator